MKRNQISKIIAIIALCIAVVGITLGFAAFSNTLTISSSATVSPDSGDFITTIYGIEKDDVDSDNFTESSFTSKTISKPIYTEGNASIATIDNSKKNQLTIKNMSTTLNEPSQPTIYMFMVKNEGQYDAYLQLDSLEENYRTGGTGTCVAIGDTSESLVNEACTSIKSAVRLLQYDSSGELVDIMEINNYDFTKKHKIEKNDYIYLYVEIIYTNVKNNGTGEEAVRADGPFEVKFEDITLNFSTTA